MFGGATFLVGRRVTAMGGPAEYPEIDKFLLLARCERARKVLAQVTISLRFILLQCPFLALFHRRRIRPARKLSGNKLPSASNSPRRAASRPDFGPASQEKTV
jgi:hypothetical protein